MTNVGIELSMSARAVCVKQSKKIENRLNINLALEQGGKLKEARQSHQGTGLTF